MPELELHGRKYPSAGVAPWTKESRFPRDKDSVLIDVGKDQFIASTKGIDFRGVRFGDPVRIGDKQGTLATFRDVADTFADKADRLGRKLSQVPEWIGLHLMVAKARVASFFMGLASRG